MCVCVWFMFVSFRMAKFTCPLCSNFATLCYTRIFQHIRDDHLIEPNRDFQCGINGCGSMFTPAKHLSFKTHVYSKHRSIMNLDPPIILPTETCFRGSNLTDEDMHPPSPILPSETIDNQMPIASKQRNNLKHKVALFIVRALAERNLTQKALDGIVHDMKSLVEVLIEEIQAKLTDLGVEFSLTDVMDANVVRPFDDLDTEYKRSLYIQRHFNYIVSS